MNDRLIQNSVVLMYRCTEAHAIPCTWYNNNVVDCLTPLLVNTLQLNIALPYSLSWYSITMIVLSYYTAVVNWPQWLLQLVTISLSKTQLSTNSLQYMAAPYRNHFVVYFELIVAYKVLYQWTSAMGGAHMLFLTVPQYSVLFIPCPWGMYQQWF